MTAKAVQKDTVQNMLIGRWEQVAAKLTTLAEAVPEEKYESRPVDGVRTIAEVLRHVAFWNRYVADTLRGKKADDTANELPGTEYASKARIVDALKRSANDAASALREQPGELEWKTAEMVVTFLEHSSEHYGQMVVYARWNGIVPPASRS